MTDSGPGSTSESGTTGDPTTSTTGESDSESESGSSGGETEGETGGEEVVVPAPGGLRRLLAHQYVATIDMLLGSPAADAAVPPADATLGGFDAVAAAELPLPPSAVQEYEASAYAVADAAMANRNVLGQTVPCVTQGPRNDACYEAFASDFAALAWRRPVTDEERDGLVAIAQEGRTWGSDDFDTGLRYALAAVLQSSSFLYIVEVGTEDPESGFRRLQPRELATRMSFFLVGRGPTGDLLAEADAGGLDDDADVRAVAQSLLAHPGARRATSVFFDELFLLRELPHKGKDAQLFPVYDEDLAASMREESLRLVEHVVFDEDASFLDLLDADYTFVDDRLAALYGIAPPANDWDMVTLPPGQGRAGMLTQPAFLASFSHPDMNSPTRRGLFVQEALLCTNVPPPPPEVNPTLPEPPEATTLRELLEYHMNEQACAGCHQLMDPIGFAFEHFDAIGAYRTTDNGFPVDASGDVGGLGTFSGAAELAALVREDSRLPGCMIRNVYRNALGSFETEDQRAGIDSIEDLAAGSDFRLSSIMVELVASDLFRMVEEPK